MDPRPNHCTPRYRPGKNMYMCAPKSIYEKVPNSIIFGSNPTHRTNPSVHRWGLRVWSHNAILQSDENEWATAACRNTDVSHQHKPAWRSEVQNDNHRGSSLIGTLNRQRPTKPFGNDYGSGYSAGRVRAVKGQGRAGAPQCHQWSYLVGWPSGPLYMSALSCVFGLHVFLHRGSWPPQRRY